MKPILIIVLALIIFSCGKPDLYPTPLHPDQVVPGLVTLSLPERNAVYTTGAVISDSQSSVTFSWKASANTDSYELDVKNLLDSTVTTKSTSQTQLSVTLTRNTPYSWYVKATSKKTAATAQSDYCKFYNAGPRAATYPPFPADIISPTNGQHLSATGTINLSWKGCSVNNNIFGYDVYFGTTKTPSLLKSGVTDMFLNNVSVSSGTTYYWKIVTKDANGKMSSSALSQFTINVGPFLQAYTAFDGTQYSLYDWQGKYVSLLIRTKDLNPSTMYNWVHVMDLCYLYYKSVTGREPSKNTNVTYINNRTTIADVASTCGAGCGYLGATGIEMLNDYTDRMYNYARKNMYDQELFYEFGRNFWFYSDQLAYKTNDPVTTGYAVFMRFMAMDATKVKPAPFNTTPWATFRSTEESLVDIYVADPNYTWTNTLGANSGVQNSLGLGATDLFASFLMRLKRDYGGNAFVNNFWKDAGMRPAAYTTQDAVDNFVLAACAAANKNLSALFVSKWKWPVSANARTTAANYP